MKYRLKKSYQDAPLFLKDLSSKLEAVHFYVQMSGIQRPWDQWGQDFKIQAKTLTLG